MNTGQGSRHHAWIWLSILLSTMVSSIHRSRHKPLQVFELPLSYRGAGAARIGAEWQDLTSIKVYLSTVTC